MFFVDSDTRHKPEPRITLNEVSKVYPIAGSSRQELFHTAVKGLDAGGKIAVAGVSLEIQQGDRVGIVGRNGAGKSTLLHMIGGLTAPSSGSIEIEGKVTSIMTLGIGLRDDLSGRENVYLDGEIQGKSRAEIDEVIDEIIVFADLSGFIDYPLRTYSTGMKSRLAFSMISHIDPEILLIDEALSAGDANFSVKATARIREICARGKIVLIASHGMQSIRDMCNRCLWMDNGRVIRDGDPVEVTKAYISSVRAADEALLMERFRKFIGTRSLQEGWAVTRVTLLNGEFDEERVLLEAGQRTRIQIVAVAPMDAVDAVVGVRIVRLDGLLVFNERFPVGTCRLHDQSVGLEIEMNPLVLGTAIYRLDVSLESATSVLAEHSSIFEVVSLTPPSGGKPMLLYPINASATLVG